MSVMWKELTAEDLRAKAAAKAIVVLPVASMEQHGPHLPVGVDTFLCEAVCRAGADLAAKDVPVVVAPTLWCGMAEHHMAFGGTFTFEGVAPGDYVLTVRTATGGGPFVSVPVTVRDTDISGLVVTMHPPATSR